MIRRLLWVGLLLPSLALAQVQPSFWKWYTLPPATAATLGGVKAPTCSSGYFYAGIDGSGQLLCVLGGGGGGGSGLSADPAACSAGQYVTDLDINGVLSCATPTGTYSLPTASAATLGGIKVGSTLGIAAGVLDYTNPNPTPYSLPAASTTLGGVKMASACGAGNHVASIGALGELGCTADAGGGYTLPAATAVVRGGITVGARLTITGDVLSADVQGGGYTLPALTASVLGGVKGTGAALACTLPNVATGFDAAGALQCAQPTNITGNAAGATTAASANAVTGAVVTVANHTATGTPSATTFHRGDNTWSVPAGTYALPDSTSLVTGGVRLTGDLGGTATSPTVPGLTGKAGNVTCGANTWASTLGATSSCTQPAFSNISGTASAGQIPALAYLPVAGAAASANLINGAVVTVANHSATGTPSATTYYRGDNTWSTPAGGGGAPTTSGYWTTIADAGLSAEVAMGALTAGLILNTPTTGVPTIYAGTSCTNQFPRSLNASGAATCAGLGVADFTANQGTATQVLHGNAAGQPSWGAIVAGDLPTATVAKGGTGLTAIAANQLFVGTAADTVTAKTLTNCTGASDALSYNTTTNAFGCTTISAGAPSFSGLVAGGAIYAATTTTVASTAAGTATWMSLHSGGTGAPTWEKSTAIVLTTAAWTSSAVANTLGIVGAGATPLTSPTYAAAAPFGFRCQLLTTRPSTTNQPRYGIQSSGTVTAIDATAVIGLAGTAPVRTTAMYDITALATASCAAGCTANVVTGGATRSFVDTVEGAGVMNASGTLSLVMAPSAAVAHTIKIGSNCIWF